MAVNASDIPATELSFTRFMTDTEGRWEQHGEYAIWSGAPTPGDPPFVLHEWHDNRVLRIPRAAAHPVLHRIAGGVPFEVAHLFGFWMSVDVDTAWVDHDGPDGQRCALMVGGAKGKPGEAQCLWICPKCGAPFERASFTIPHQRLERFLDFAQERVRAFNADAGLRTCPGCGAVHPPSYGFYAERDGDDERAARRAP
jgi:hypothetical protein